MIKDFFTTNIWLKISSLVLAITLWFFVILSGRTGTDLNVPVVYINLPEKLEILEAQKSIRVSIEGQERVLENIKQNEISAVIDLSEASDGKSFHSLSKENIRLPGALEVVSFDPETISLTIEKHLKKSVKVKPSIIGLPKEGYVIYSINVKPEEVLIEGPRSIVANIYSIRTDPIDITGIKRDREYNASLNMNVSSIRKNVQKVKLNITVKKIQ